MKPSTVINGQIFIVADLSHPSRVAPSLDIIVTDSTPEKLQKIFDQFNRELDSVVKLKPGANGKPQVQRHTAHQVRAFFPDYNNWPIVKAVGARNVIAVEIYEKPATRYLGLTFNDNSKLYMLLAKWEKSTVSEKIENAQFEAMAKTITLR